MSILINMPEIKGFESTGEYREPKIGEYYLSSNKDDGNKILLENENNKKKKRKS